MSRRSKNLKNQLQYVITKSAKIGTSKRAEARNGVDTKQYIYSVNRLDVMRDFSSTFARYMKENFPDVRQAKDLETRHFEAFVKDRGSQWSAATCAEYEGRIHKLGCMVSRVFGLNKNFDLTIEPQRQQNRASGRDRMMSAEHVAALRAHLEAGESAGKWVPAIASTIGARSEEIRSISAKDIDLGKRVVHLTNCKNGKNRDVPIREQHLPLYRQILEHVESNNWETVCHGMGEKAVNAALRRGMQAVGISDEYPKSSNHAIRKYYANERYREEKAKGFSNKEAFTVVCKELGHNTYRASLFRVYITDPD